MKNEDEIKLLKDCIGDIADAIRGNSVHVLFNAMDKIKTVILKLEQSHKGETNKL